MNYIPFITSQNFITKQTIKLLIDTGANKNIIRPGIITNCKPSKKTKIKNISGHHTINSKGKANLIRLDIPIQTYYELKFHDFFDGIIGSEFLAKSKAKIDYNRENTQIGNVSIPFEKYFPSQKLYSYHIEIDTTVNGEWLVPTFQRLYKSAIIEPGLYKSQNKKSTVKILTNKRNPPRIEGEFKLKVNNFETITPIPINNDTEINEQIIT